MARNLFWMVCVVGLVCLLAPAEGQRRFPPLEPGIHIVAPNGKTPRTVDLEDFIAFARAYDTQQGDEHFNPLADTNDDGVVDFGDFVRFAQAYGRTLSESGGVKLR